MTRVPGHGFSLLTVAAFCLIVAALADPEIPFRTHDCFRALVFDNTASFQPDQEKLERFVSEYTSDLRSGDEWSLWLAGEEPLLLVSPRSGTDLPRIPSLPVTARSSDIRGTVAAAGFSTEGRGEIVVLSDGRDTGREGPLPDGILPVYPVDGGYEVPVDARIVSASAPVRIAVDRPFTIEAEVRADGIDEVIITVMRDGTELDRRTVRMTRDGYSLSIEDSRRDEGLYRYQVTVRAHGDVFSVNDSWELPVAVGDSRQALVVTPFGRNSVVFRMLEDAPGFEVDTCLAKELRGRDLSSYSAVILEGADDELHSDPIALLASWVKNGGGGLVAVSGGPEREGTFLGETELADVLPVRFDKDEDPDHLIVALDRSGSMAKAAGESVKIHMAKKAALAASSFVGDRDPFDVIAFSDSGTPVHSSVGPGEGLGEAMASIEASGGTSILAVLSLAVNRFDRQEAGNRFLILISDGFAEEGDLSAITEILVNEHIVVSAVGIGDEVNEELLSTLAAKTGGKWIHLENAADMPDVVAEEVRSRMTDDFITGAFEAELGDSHPAVSGITQPPSFGGYSRCSARDEAQTAVASSDGDPVLVLWQISAGRSAFISVPLVEEYASEWFAWKDLRKLVEGTVTWCARRQSSSEGIGVLFDGSTVVIELAREAGDDAGFTALCETGDDETGVGMREIRSGFWQGRLPAAEAGLLAVRVLDDNGKEVAARTVFVPYASEFRQTGTDRAALERLASSTGGSVLRMGQLPPSRPSGAARRSLTHLLTALAVLCLAGDVVLTRIGRRRSAHGH